MLVVHASELAASVDMHRYRPVAEVAVDLFARKNPIAYAAAMTRNTLQEKPSISSVLEKFAVTDAVSEAVAATPDALHTKLQGILKDTTIASDPTVVADIQSYVYTERGKIAEEPSLDTAEIEMKQKIQQRNSRYYKKYISYGADGQLQLGGKVDGITEGGQLVEMKNRQRRLFPTVPVYEKVQVHAYMFLTDIKECRLIQRFKDTNDTTIVPFDEPFWEEIVRRLTILATRMDEVDRDEKQQDRLVNGHFTVDFTQGLQETIVA